MKNYCKKFLVTFVMILLSYQGVISSSASSFNTDGVPISPVLSNIILEDERQKEFVDRCAKIYCKETETSLPENKYNLEFLNAMRDYFKDKSNYSEEYEGLFDLIIKNYCLRLP